MELQWNAVNLQWTDWQPLLPMMIVTMSHPTPTIVRPCSVNSLSGGSVHHIAMNCIALFPNWVLCGQSFQYVLVYNFTNMHAISHRSGFFACSSIANIQEPSGCIIIILRLAVSRVGIPSLLIPTTMADLKCLNTSLLEVMISCNNEHFFIRDLSDLTLQISFDTWWASMNVDSKCPIVWNNSRHVPSWGFYLHCRIEETGISGIICISCHQVVCHQSENGTNSMGKHLLANAHIAMLNKLTNLDVTKLTSLTVNTTALAILKRQGSCGITIVSSQRKFTFHYRLSLYLLNGQIKHSKLAANDFDTAKFHHDTSNRYLMLGFVLAHIPWNAISNLELQWSYNALWSQLVLQSANTMRNISSTEYTLMLDAIKKQLPSRNQANLAFDRWRSMNELAIKCDIAYCLDQKWALHEVQLPFDEFVHQIFCLLES